jgi:hypothetical protein
MTVNTPGAYRATLADSLDGQSRWRAHKAERWPDDERNARSSRGLDAAAEYVRGLDEQNPGVRRFVELAERLDAEEAFPWPTDPHTIVGGSYTASRFFFGKGSREPEPSDFDRLLEDMFDETLYELRRTADWINAQPSPDLGRYFADHGYPLWDDEEDENDV